MPSNSYSFKDVKAAISGPGGVITLGDGSGAAEEGITIEPTGEIDTMQIGADGKGQHSLSSDKSGRLTVRVLKTSPVNALLAAMLAFQRSGSSTWGQNTISLVDLARGDIVTCQQCAFASWPSLTYAKEAGTNEWVFNSIIIDPTLGGL